MLGLANGFMCQKLLSINASYSLYWDIIHDWGFVSNPSKAAGAVCVGTSMYQSDGSIAGPNKAPDCTPAFFRPKLRFGFMISLVILVTDAILRFSWTLRFYHKLFPSADSFVLCTQFLEVFRYV